MPKISEAHSIPNERAPFFGILIPTSNRPSLVKETIQSVLHQTFYDYELLISNNGPDPQTRSIANQFCKCDTRIRYIEYDNLSMHTHWEKATSNLTARYILILTDRSLLFRNSLNYIYQKVVDHCFPDLISWRMSQYLDDSSILLNNPIQASSALTSAHILDPQHVFLDEISGVNSTWSERLPRGLNSAVSRHFIDQLRCQYGPLFRPISPDFTFASFCLLNSKSLLFIDRPLFLTRAMNVSNGGLGYSGEINPSFIQSLGQGFTWFRHVPCKEFMISNMIFEDFLEIASTCKHDTVFDYFNLASYYRMLFRELKAKILYGKLQKTRLVQIHNNILDSIPDLELKAELLASSHQYLSVSIWQRLKTILVKTVERFFPAMLSYLRRTVIILRGHGRYFPSALDAASSAGQLET